MKGTAWLRNVAPFAGPRLILLALGIAVLLASIALAVGGAPPAEALILLAAGLVCGAVVTGWISGGRGVAVLAGLVVVQYILLGQAPEPWSSLSAIIIPANGGGMLLGQVISEARLARRRPVMVDAWVVNGQEQATTDQAKAAATGDLARWDSAADGGFVVARNAGRFEAVGSAATGFIVHCTADYHRDDGGWQLLGGLTRRDEKQIRIPSGPAFAPGSNVVDLDTVSLALHGFFHYRGPDPHLSWVSGEDVLEFRYS